MNIITENKPNTLIPSCVSTIAELDITATDKSLIENLKQALEEKWEDERFLILSTQTGEYRLVNKNWRT